MNIIKLPDNNKKLAVGETIKATLGRFKIITSENGQVVSETDWIKNKIVKSDANGVNLLVRALIGDATYSVEITHAKIGTGTNAPADTDTDLQTPVNLSGGSNPSIIRGDDSIVSINIAHLEFFISNAELPNGTYTEWGLFTGTYPTDKLFSRALITPSYTKSTNQDTTIIHEITINN